MIKKIVENKLNGFFTSVATNLVEQLPLSREAMGLNLSEGFMKERVYCQTLFRFVRFR